jgi:hypothetical protein
MEIDLSNLSAATRQKVDEIFRTDFDLNLLKAVRRQTAIAARNHLDRPRAQDGFGERVFVIDAYIDALWRNFYGPNYTEDRDLMRFLAKRNPEIKVRSQGTRVQVGYSTVGRGVRFSRKYKSDRTDRSNKAEAIA